MYVTGGDAKDCESLLIKCQARCHVELQLPRYIYIYIYINIYIIYIYII